MSFYGQFVQQVNGDISGIKINEQDSIKGEVNIQGDLKVNGGSISTPTAADVSYDNTTSGLTADDVQEAVDELAGLRVKNKTFENFNDLVNWILTNRISL